MPDNLKLYFSLVSGEMYYIEEDEVKNVKQTEIPLIAKPSDKCNKCYGRFYEGRHANLRAGKWQHDFYVPCTRCSKKLVDWENLSDKDISIENTVTTNELQEHDRNENLVNKLNEVNNDAK